MDPISALNLGCWSSLGGAAGTAPLMLPADHLLTHGVVVGMTGSGKTGLVTVMIEEALRSGIPCIVIDVKGDLPNLLLSPPRITPDIIAPWIDPGRDPAQAATELQQVFGSWGLDDATLSRYDETTTVRLLTPGATSGESLHMLSTLERRSVRWDTDPESAREALGAAVSLVLRLIGRDPDPARSKEHVLLSVLAERRLAAGQNADLGSLMDDLLSPPIDRIGALSVDTFFKKADRRNLAAGLNTLLASPSFAAWRQGESLEVAEWVKPRNGRTPAVIVSVAHLDDDERGLVLGVLLQEILCWVRTLGGSQHLQALVVFDEVYGFLPPHPANPPSKRPLVGLMKQARGFGVGVVVATQNPMDLDYRALSNAGVWCIGRLQTDADRARVLDGLTCGGAADSIAATVQSLATRWFLVRNSHCQGEPILLQPRQTFSLLRGPMTRGELRKAIAWREHLPVSP